MKIVYIQIRDDKKYNIQNMYHEAPNNLLN